MSETDRVRVPTNGHRPPLDVAEAAEPSATPDPSGETLTPADPRIVFSPGQVAAGLGILAGLILLIAGSRRGKRG